MLKCIFSFLLFFSFFQNGLAKEGVIAPSFKNSNELILIHGLSIIIPPGEMFVDAEKLLPDDQFKIVSNLKHKPKKALEGLALKWKELLSKELERCKTGGYKFHFVGHSLGGLIIRRLLLDPEVQPCMASVTTIASPHRGSDLANMISPFLPVDALDSLKTDAMANYNEKHLLMELEISKKWNIPLWSIVANPLLKKERRGTFSYWSLVLLNWVGANILGFPPGDGLVSFESQKYGKVLGELPYTHSEITNYHGETPQALKDVFQLVIAEIKKSST